MRVGVVRAYKGVAGACGGVARACRGSGACCRGVVRACRVWCDQEYGGGGLNIHQKRKKSAIYGLSLIHI